MKFDINEKTIKHLFRKAGQKTPVPEPAPLFLERLYNTIPKNYSRTTIFRIRRIHLATAFAVIILCFAFYHIFSLKNSLFNKEKYFQPTKSISLVYKVQGQDRFKPTKKIKVTDNDIFHWGG